MLGNLDAEKMVYQDWALKALEILPQEKKDELILTGLYRQLMEKNFKWEAEKAFEKYAEAHAAEYLSQPEFQRIIKEKARRAVDSVFDQLIDELTKKYARNMKWAAEATCKSLGE